MLWCSAAPAATAEGFAPIPVRAIFAPLKAHGSADQALASGRVLEQDFAMAPRAAKPWRIAFLFPHLKDPYWVGCNYGVISEARRLGVAVDVFPAEGYNDLIGQLRQMEEAVAARYDAIVLSPLSMTANNPAIASARARGIPVFELANDSSSDDLTLKVTTSLKGMGRDATDWVIRDALARGKRAINIALLPGPADAGWVKGEVDGTREQARKAPIKVNIVAVRYGDSDRIEQARQAAALLAEHGAKLDYILGCTGCAPAAILPLKMAGLQGKVRVVAYDLTREIAAMIRSGDIVAAADTKGVSQARVAINAVVNHLQGQAGRPAPHTVLVKLGLVDRANQDSYPFDTSTAPDDFVPLLHYTPPR